MAQSRFNCFDVFLTIISLLTFLVDVGSDIAVTTQFFLNKDTVWGSLMLTFTVVPLVVMNGFSLKWHSTDGSLSWSMILIHVLLLAPIQRYVRIIWFGVKSLTSGHPKYKDAALREQNDASILRLFETFLESAPQLVLQLYIILRHTHHDSWIQGISAGSSLISLAWALTAYCDTSRLNYQSTYRRRFVALLLHSAWQLCMAASRVAALVLFATVYPAWLLLVAGVHWIAMTAWIWLKGTDFGQGRVERALFRIVSGFMYIFVYLNVHDGPTRGRMAFYYCIVFIENCVLFAVWIIANGQPDVNWKIGASVIIFGGFVVGGVCMILYYRWFHPSGPNYMFCVKATIPSTLPPRPHSPKERRSSQSQSIIPPSSPPRNDMLEVSIESETGSHRDASATAQPVRSALKGASQSGVLDSSARDALETAWQSGMGSSSSSSCSSLEEGDCSLDDFNTTSRSDYSALLEPEATTTTTTKTTKSKSSSSKRSHRSSGTSDQVTVDTANTTASTTSELSPFNNTSATTVLERVSESDHESPLLHSLQREDGDGTEATGDSHSHHSGSGNRHSGLGNRRSSSGSRTRGRDGGRRSRSSLSPQQDASLSPTRDLSYEDSVQQASYLDDGQTGGASFQESGHGPGRRSGSRQRSFEDRRDSRRDSGRLEDRGDSNRRRDERSDSDRRRDERRRSREGERRPDADISRNSREGARERMSALSPLNDRLWSDSQPLSSAASDIVTPTERIRALRNNSRGRLSRSFDLDLGETPITSPRGNGGEAPMTPLDTPLFTPEETPFVSPQAENPVGGESEVSSPSTGRDQREAMASYPVSVDTSPADNLVPGNQRLYEEDGAGGESLWGFSPDTSNSSGGRQALDPSVTLPGSRPRPRLVESFNSESDSPALDVLKFGRDRRGSAMQQQAENRRLEALKRGESMPGKRSSVAPSGRSPLTPITPGVHSDGECETSWSSMNVNEDENSGLNNLKNLTPDDSLCSFASNEETPRPQVEDEDEREFEQSHAREAPMSGASTPSLARSRSTSSLYYEFGSAGVSPSPPPGMKSGRMSGYSSYLHTPSGAVWSAQEPATPWRLDYLNVDPAPPVPDNARRNDPRDVIIDLLMEQVKRSSFRASAVPSALRPSSSNLSPLNISNLSHSQSPAALDRSVDNRHAWRRYLEQDPNATLLGHPAAASTHSAHPDPRSSRRHDDIDLMRKALDLIEVLRSQPSVDRLTNSSGSSPEVYVSGQYRPPIISQQQRERDGHLTALSQSVLSQFADHAQADLRTPFREGDRHSSAYPLSVERQPSRARQDSSSSLRPGQAGSLPGHYRPERSQPPVHARQLSQASVTGVQPQSALQRSLPGGVGERQGIYRYFVDSESPIPTHTPQWSNTPHLTPSTTPSAKHLLHRYLSHNHMETPHYPHQQQGRVPDLLPSSDALSSRSHHDGVRGQGRSRDHAPVVYNEEGRHAHGSAIYSEDEGTRGEGRERRRSGGQRSSQGLSVVVDPDSGMHSDSQSAASRRQPLQSLDSNSPSLSPSSSSITQQPPHRPHKGRSSSGTRSDNSSVLSSSQASLSPKLTVRPRMLAGTLTAGPASSASQRHGTGRRDAHRMSTVEGSGNSSAASLSSRARSSDCLR